MFAAHNPTPDQNPSFRAGPEGAAAGARLDTLQVAARHEAEQQALAPLVDDERVVAGHELRQRMRSES